MVNKRAGLNLMSAQIIKIILAIIGIIMVIAIIVVFYNMFFGNSGEQQAKGTLDRMFQTISSLQQGKSDYVLIYVPIGWTVVAFDNTTNKYDKFTKPNSFAYKYALCICKKACKPEICRQLQKPLMKDNKFFLLPIKGFNKFYIEDVGDIYNIKEKNLNVGNQQITTSETTRTYQKDSTWSSLGEFEVTRYYTPYESDFTAWKSSTSRTDGDGMYYCTLGEKQFYETVKCEGSGLGSGGEIYSYSSIKETKAASVPSTSCSSCEFGATSLGTDPTPGRTIAVDPSIIPSSSQGASVVYLEFDCSLSSCQEECEKWSNKYYLAEDRGGAIKGQHIDLYVGAGKAMLSGTNCLPGKANLWVSPTLVSVATIKAEDAKNEQAAGDVA
jgi:3D (Asp-Asp-Asp) domain-containing protein